MSRCDDLIATAGKQWTEKAKYRSDWQNLGEAFTEIGTHFNHKESNLDQNIIIVYADKEIKGYNNNDK